jgi:hypothetical protein
MVMVAAVPNVRHTASPDFARSSALCLATHEAYVIELNDGEGEAERLRKIAADFDALALLLQEAMATGCFAADGDDMEALRRAKLAAEKGALLARRAIPSDD